MSKAGGVQPRGTEFKAPEEEALTQLAPDGPGSCACWVGVPVTSSGPRLHSKHQALLFSNDHGKGSHDLGLDAALPFSADLQLVDP